MRWVSGNYGWLRVTGLGLGLGIWAISGSSAMASGGKGGDGLCGWGEYGFGPHFRRPRHGQNDFGPPYFTHAMGPGTPYNGAPGNFNAGFPYFGPYTGAPANPDRLPPYSIAESNVAGSGSGADYASAYVAPTPTESERNLGFDQVPVVDAGGARGMRISQVYPGTAAAKARLQAGDVIQSINGYQTIQQENLAWIMASAAPDRILRLIVRAAADGKEHTITIPLP